MKLFTIMSPYFWSSNKRIVKVTRLFSCRTWNWEEILEKKAYSSFYPKNQHLRIRICNKSKLKVLKWMIKNCKSIISKSHLLARTCAICACASVIDFRLLRLMTVEHLKYAWSSSSIFSSACEKNAKNVLQIGIAKYPWKLFIKHTNVTACNDCNPYQFCFI